MEDVPVDLYPIFYQTFEFPEPGVAVGRLTSRDLSYSMWCKLEERTLQTHNFGDQEGFRISPGRPEAFCRLLAKTAHAFAIAEFGDIFQPILTGYIVQSTHSFSGAFIAATAFLLLGIAGYIFLLGRIEPIPDPA